MLYREARKEDARTIVEFQLAMARETEELRLDHVVCAEGVQGVFEEPSRGRYFVCESGGKVIASLLICYEWSDWRNGTVWWIHSVFVLPEFRKLGAFSGLYSHIQSLAAEDDSVRGLRLYVDKRNEAAKKVYRRIGMTDEHYSLFEWMKTF
jgi:GNAT superfamily N-acetyltransferase